MGGEEMERRHMKRLPCGHCFHFGCIDRFHMEKMREDNNMDCPCYTCSEPSNKSIASLVEERKKKRDAEAAANAGNEAAALKTGFDAEAQRPAFSLGAGEHPRRRGGGAMAALAQATREQTQ